jgi:outer membrane receptor protein involved in Fe transport
MCKLLTSSRPFARAPHLGAVTGGRGYRITLSLTWIMALVAPADAAAAAAEPELAPEGPEVEAGPPAAAPPAEASAEADPTESPTGEPDPQSGDEPASEAPPEAPAAGAAESPGEGAAGDAVEDDIGLDLESDMLELLDASVVTAASRTAEDSATAPATMTTITADEIRLYGMTTLSEVLNYFGLGMNYVENGGNEGAPTISARGVAIPGDGGNHVLLMVNGHVINDSWGGWAFFDDRFALPLEMIDHIEIINGPGSVLYGTSAMYGVVNVVTKDGADYRGVHAVAQGRVLLPGGPDNELVGAGGSNRLGWGARASAGVANGFKLGELNGSATVQLEHIEFQGPTHQFGPQAADWDPGPFVDDPGVWGGVAAPDRRITGGFLGLTLGRFSLDIKGSYWRRRHIEDYQADFNDPDNFEAQGNLHVDLRHSIIARPGVTVATRVFGDYVPYAGAWNYTDVDAWCLGLTGRCESSEQTLGSIYGLEEVVSWDWFVNQKVVTLVGADVRGRTVADNIDFVDKTTGEPAPYEFIDYVDTTAAGSVFLQQNYRPIKQLGFNVGARLDLDQNFGWHISPRAAIAYQPIESNTIKLMFSEAFRAPLLGEIRFEDPTYFIRAENLQDEVVRSLELSVEQKLPGGRGFVRAGGFYGWWFDLVGEVAASQEQFDRAVAEGRLSPDADPSFTTTYANTGEIQAYGGYASADLRDPGGLVRFGTNVSVAESQLESAELGSVEVARTPLVSANARIALTPKGYVPSFALAAFYLTPMDTPEGIAGSFTAPRQTGHHVQGRFTISGDVPKAPGLSYRVFADYTVNRTGPNVVGQLNYSEAPSTFGGELTPLARMTVFFGLRYDFDWTARASQP